MANGDHGATTAVVDDRPPDDPPPRPGPQALVARLDATAVAVIAAATAFGAAVVAAVVRAFVSDWYPVGDNAFFALRSRDVLTEHHPLLGTWTSASQTVGFHLNNPGPLLFDVLAVPAKVDPTFVPVGVAGLVVASVVTMAVFAGRVAGRRGVLAVLFASAALAWAMGPELLIDPWQPHALLFPFLGLIGVTWSAVAGSDGALIAAVALGSLVVQTHLSYAPLVAALGTVALASVVLRAVRVPARRRRAWWMLACAALVGLLLWSQPLVEQVTAEEKGNLARVLEVTGTDRGEQLGQELGVRVAGTVVSPVPRWMPPSFEDAFVNVPTGIAGAPELERMSTLPLAALSLVTALGALAAVALVARRRGGLTGASGVVALVVVLAVVTATLLPWTVYGLPPHHIRWLWPTSIAVTTVLVAGLMARRPGVFLVALATVAMSVLATVPTHPEIGPTADLDAAPVMRDLAPQLDELRGRGPLLLSLEGLRLFEPYSTPVVMELDERGVDVVVDEAGMTRQLGPGRAATGDEEGRLFVWQGELAVQGAPGMERVAFVAGLSDQEREELARRGDDVARWMRAGELRLTELGRAAVDTGRIPDLEQLMVPDADPFAVGPGAIRLAIEEGYLVSAVHQAELDRWADLRNRFERQTVGLWVDWAEGQR